MAMARLHWKTKEFSPAQSTALAAALGAAPAGLMVRLLAVRMPPVDTADPLERLRPGEPLTLTAESFTVLEVEGDPEGVTAFVESLGSLALPGASARERA